MITVNRRVELATLKPHPRNYNRHPAAQVERIAASLRKFGQVRSIVVWRSTILAGHGVVEAARALGWQEITADVLPDDYPEHLALAYVAADNELGRLGDPDHAALAAILEESRAADAELLQAIGYSDQEFQALLAEVGAAEKAQNGDAEPQLDRAEELRQKWGVELGQLWQLGEHRLICGDCTDAAVVERVMGKERADFLVTDPPYVLQSASDKAAKADANDQALRHFLRNCWLAVLPHMQSHAGAVWFCNWRTVDCVRTATMTRNEKNYQAAVWYKGKGATPGTPWMNTVEMMLFYSMDGYDYKKTTGLDNHVSIPWGGGTRANHPAEKPVEVYVYALTPMNAGDLVIDPFLGSGTTLIACERLGRRCRAVEIEPKYVAVALERWATATGKTPVLIE